MEFWKFILNKDQITKSRNGGIKMAYHGRSKSGTSRFTNKIIVCIDICSVGTLADVQRD